MEFENELDKLRAMLDEANIPYESTMILVPELLKERHLDYYSGNNRFVRNQIIYDPDPERPNSWKFDAICQLGSYGSAQGLLETFGELGTDAEGDPLVMTAEEAFYIIEEDWENKNGRAEE